MELNIDFPQIGKDASPDVKKLYTAVTLLSEQLKYVLSNLDEENFVTRLRDGVGGVSSVKADVSDLKAAIIKTAETVRLTREHLAATLRNEYVALSDLGEYTEEAIASYEVDGKGIEQYFSLIGAVADDVEKISGYIRCGVLDGDEIGIEIGDVAGTGGSPFKVRLTGNRLSFMSGSVEVAYLSDSSLYVTKATVTGKFMIGDYEINPSDGIVFKYAGA